jgi:hypothetical protein
VCGLRGGGHGGDFVKVGICVFVGRGFGLGVERVERVWKRNAASPAVAQRREWFRNLVA